MNNDIDNDIRDAISILINKIPFCMPIISKPIKELLSKETFTATDGDYLYINYENWNKLTIQQKIGSLFKTYLHFALLHPTRGKDKKFDLWWAACSFWANSVIMNDASGGMSFNLPDGFMYDESFLDKTAEEIYNTLDDSIDKRKNNQTDQSSSPYKKFQNSKNKSNVINEFINGDIESCEKDMMQGVGGNESQIKYESDMAMEMHKNLRQGDLPAGLDREFKHFLSSKIKWTKILKAFWKQITTMGDQRSYRSPKKWAWEYGFALPGEFGIKKPTATVIFDTSGSITQIQINEFISEISKILSNVEFCWVITCDAKVHETIKIKKLSEITVQKKLKMKGGGGTDFVPALITAKSKKTDITIYFTDGYGNFGKKIGIQNLLWVIAGSNIKPPFGKSIYM